MANHRESEVGVLVIRLILIVFYVLVIYVLAVPSLLVIAIQWLMLVARRDRLQLLDDFAGQLVGFFTQIVAYIFFLSDERPFPFNTITPFKRQGAEPAATAAAAQESPPQSSADSAGEKTTNKPAKRGRPRKKTTE